ncbi:lamin tail domain-containing protein [Candidatus Woesearchaeota archaeon]|nr:lamin tail domain-containing protein [Candidatus Woesearchaeota archaeon]
MTRKIVLICLFFTLSYSVNAELRISEIMYDPEGSDTGREWIELYNAGNDSINLSGWRFREAEVDHGISLCSGNITLLPLEYMVAARDPEAFGYEYNISGMLMSSSFSLSNSAGEELIFFDDTTNESCAVNYSDIAEEGYSISLFNDTWLESEPTPFQANIERSFYADKQEEEKAAQPQFSLSSNMPGAIYLGGEYDSFFRITNNYYEKGQDKIYAGFYYNISIMNSTVNQSHEYVLLHEESLNVSLKSYTSQTCSPFLFGILGQYQICGAIEGSNFSLCVEVSPEDPGLHQCNISLSLGVEKQLFEEGEKIYFFHELSNESFPYQIEYWVEDLFGKQVKKPVLTKNTNKKSYTPKFDETDMAFIIKSKLAWIACNNSNNQTEGEYLVVVRGSADDSGSVSEEEDKSTIRITSISQQAIFGGLLKADVKVYKGDTRKYSVKAYVAKGSTKVSETTSINLKSQYQEYEFSLPIQLKCSDDPGEYTLVVEGLDAKAEKKLYIGQSDECGQKTQISTETKEKVVQYELVYFTANASDEVMAAVRLTNPENKSHNYSVWSYVYRGSKSYSGEREKNKIGLSVDGYGTDYVLLKNTFTDISAGDYKFKVLVQRDDRKTPNEIIQEIKVNIPETAASESHVSSELKKDEKEEDSIIEKSTDYVSPATAKTIYMSSSAKLKDYSLYFIIAVLFLAGVAFFKLR